jgi:exosortase B
MVGTTPRRDLATQPVALSWVLIGAGFLAMYAPIYWSAAHGLWQAEEQGHGPIVLAISAWFLWAKRHELMAADGQPDLWAGGAALGLGILIYLVGRTFSVASLEFISQIVVICGLLAGVKGRAALRLMWFPLIYLVFAVPLPASILDAVTVPLKNWISLIVVDVLYALGLPTAREGVTISIGNYRLLVADACTGLNSMFSLAAVGALFMYVVARRSRLHNAIMIASMLPIAFVANILRVIALVVITYRFGDEAGQGFLHGAAGTMLFLVALLMFVALDSLLGVLVPSGRARV